ncbi:glycine oxidase ThiO [Aestuariirhabdus litorea]|uniref:Glycine oxidase ThiO n=1 Tax=Aestuariirhabdus litorea TaxID=2528527 RepID=A0A3P3VKP0_9GAMM|nr:glycine oxidase ThiO [Aestuariirhabdus litorea]RRJ83260.1 glycine oxidase ThiO [Aestuariirhabdus litorea]RWW93419.1 glycine oxidase ThiO [Endozoicomonadaceae bacterium GTF-13]
MSDTLIVGAGVIGLMLARSLAQQGQRVTLLDRQALGRGASWAGGGIVSPLYPWRYPDAVTRLASWSQGFYPQLSAELNHQTHIDPQYRQQGLLMLEIDDEAQALAWSARYGRELERVDGHRVRELEPALGGDRPTGLWMPTVGSIRNPRLLQALTRWVRQSPRIEVFESCGLVSLITEGGAVSGAFSQRFGRHEADAVVVAAGAWSAPLLSPFGISLPVFPVRGQMLLYRATPGLVRRVSLIGNRYVIPRRDGRVLVGSSLEYEGYHCHPTIEQRRSLEQSAEGIIPALAGFPVERHWAGLRPGSPGGIPFIGKAPGVDRLYVSAGHFRNGLVLAPASTALMTSMLTGQACGIDGAPYALPRD